MALAATPRLDTIAPELYLKITAYIQTARDLACLSNACRRFRELNDRDGWRIFVQSKFPSLVSELPVSVSQSPTGWRDLACLLTVQSRAWDRRAFSTHSLTIAFGQNKEWQSKYKHGWSSSLLQTSRKHSHNDAEQRDPRLLYKLNSGGTSLFHPKGFGGNQSNARASSQPAARRHQSTSFHPVIDAMLEFSGSLSSKKQVVAWSTGPEFVVWIMRSGNMIPKELDDSPDHTPFFDEDRNKINWFHVEHHEFSSGLDDITSINLVKPDGQIRPLTSDSLVVDLIAGRASGYLHRYSVSNVEPFRAVSNTFHSFESEGQPARRSVRSAHVSKNTEDQLLVAISDKVLSLYNAASESHDVWPIAEFDIKVEGPGVRAWTTKFLSQERLVVGLGQSTKPVQAYQTTPTGLFLTDTYGLVGNNEPIREGHRRTAGSVYAIEPLSVVSRPGGSRDGDIFLTGWYDGVCRYVKCQTLSPRFKFQYSHLTNFRLYDLRAARTPVSSYHDPIDDDSAIYSLCTYGQERFLAGSADSVVKIFDFRNGAKVYYHTDGLPCSANPPYPLPSRRKQTLGMDLLSLEDTSKSVVVDSDGSRHFMPQCHFNPHPRTCRFHQLSRTDLYRPNANLFLYGSTTTGRSVQKSPIYALSSPSGICPLVYAGTNGMVYELEVSDRTLRGDQRADPFFPTPPHTGQLFEELALYETDDGRLKSGASSAVPPLLRAFKHGVLNENIPPPSILPVAGRERRLDERWIL